MLKSLVRKCIICTHIPQTEPSKYYPFNFHMHILYYSLFHPSPTSHYDIFRFFHGSLSYFLTNTHTHTPQNVRVCVCVFHIRGNRQYLSSKNLILKGSMRNKMSQQMIASEIANLCSILEMHLVERDLFWSIVL